MVVFLELPTPARSPSPSGIFDDDERSQTPPPQDLLSEPQTPNRAVRRREEQERRKGRKPGPIPDVLRKECQAAGREFVEKVGKIADEWDAAQETIACLCGLKDKESREANQWNMWEEKWYDENMKLDGGECR